MTHTERYLVDILSSHISGAAPSFPDGVAFDELLTLSHIHKLTPIVYSTLAKHFRGRVSDKVIARFKKEAAPQISAQINKTRIFVSLYSKLASNGIRCASLKGISLRRLYPEPDLRISSDEDILARDAGFDGAKNIFLSEGFTERRSPDDESNVITFIDRTGALPIELHNSLFPRSDDFGKKLASFFDGALDRCDSIKVDETNIDVLSPSDSLLFLIFHALKHFTYCGFGLRILSDIIVFAKAYSEKIDEERINGAVHEAGADAFFDSIIKIAEKYFGVTKDALGFASRHVSDVDPENMMEDIISGGAYGNATPERLHSSTMTLSAASGKRRGALAAVFPPYSIMKTRYTFVADHKILLPAGWVLRICKKLFSKDRQFDATESVAVGRQRVALLKEYGVIK